MRLHCPTCSITHHHGGGDGPEPGGGHRWAHCLKADGSTGYFIAPVRAPWLGALVDDAEVIATARTGRPGRVRGRSMLYALVEDSRVPPGRAMLVDRSYVPLGGTFEGATIDADSAVAKAVRGLATARDGGSAWLYSDASAPWHERASAAAYLARVRAILAAAAL